MTMSSRRTSRPAEWAGRVLEPVADPFDDNEDDNEDTDESRREAGGKRGRSRSRSSNWKRTLLLVVSTSIGAVGLLLAAAVSSAAWLDRPSSFSSLSPASPTALSVSSSSLPFRTQLARQAGASLNADAALESAAAAAAAATSPLRPSSTTNEVPKAPPRDKKDAGTSLSPMFAAPAAASAAVLHLEYDPYDPSTRIKDTSVRRVGEGTSSTLFCVPWDLDTDDWWGHHVGDWTLALEEENQTHTCYRRRRKTRDATFFQSVYQLQHSSSNCTLRKMWSDGFGSDVRNVLDGMVQAVTTGVPFAVDATPWHYVALQDASQPACQVHPSAPAALRDDRTMSCFFLPLGNCPNRNQTLPNRGTVSYAGRGGRPPSFVKHWNLLEYVLRPRQWLRRHVQRYLESQDVERRLSEAMAEGGCTVVHVRRGDSVLGNSWSTSRRIYRPLSDYLLHARTKTILLLTDDANAVDEAWTRHPNFTFVHWNRTRYRGSEGGWEEHLPSRDPVHEMAVLLGTLRVVRHCRALVHTASNLGQLLYAHMVHSRPNNNDVRRVNLDAIASTGHGKRPDGAATTQ